MHWTEEARAVVSVGLELQRRGWTIVGYNKGESDPMTDYYSPASWWGIATNERFPGVVVGVKVSRYHQGELIANATPDGKAWHVEKDGIIVGTGVGLSKCASFNQQERDRGIEHLCNEIERVVRKVDFSVEAPAPAESILDRDKFVVTHNRDWTWVKFAGVPGQCVRDRLKDKFSARFSTKRSAWYIQYHVGKAEIEAAIDGKDEEYNRIREGRLMQLGDQAMERAAGIA